MKRIGLKSISVIVLVIFAFTAVSAQDKKKPETTPTDEAAGAAEALKYQKLLNALSGGTGANGLPSSDGGNANGPATNPPASPFGQLLRAARVQNDAKQNLPAGTVVIAPSKKAKGNSLAALAAETLGGELANIAMSAAGAAAMSGGPNAAKTLMMMAPGLNIAQGVMSGVLAVRKPTVTYVWTLPGRTAATALPTSTPKFEVVYGDVPGVDPDEYQPVILKLEQTRDNWRLMSAAKGKGSDAAGQGSFNPASFIQETIPARMDKLGRGHVQIEPEKPLEAGEYALVLRPIPPTQKASRKDAALIQGVSFILSAAWDFSIGAQPTTP